MNAPVPRFNSFPLGYNGFQVDWLDYNTAIMYTWRDDVRGVWEIQGPPNNGWAPREYLPANWDFVVE